MQGNGKGERCHPASGPLDGTGQVVPGVAAPMVRCTVVRGNHLFNNSRIDLIGTVQDVVVEHDTIENARAGIRVEKPVAGVRMRSNAFLNVAQPLQRPEPKGE